MNQAADHGIARPQQGRKRQKQGGGGGQALIHGRDFTKRLAGFHAGALARCGRQQRAAIRVTMTARRLPPIH